MYSINEYVMCGESGICKVVKIGNPPISGVDKSRIYYFLEPIKGKTNIIYSPVDLEKKSLRYVIKKEEAEKLLDGIETMQISWEEKDSIRKELYKKILNQYDCEKWLEMLKSVQYKKKELSQKGKKLHSMDMIYIVKIEKLLYEEFSFAIGTTIEDVTEKIAQKMKTD